MYHPLGYEGWHEQEAPDFQSIWDKTPRARKNYECDRCQETIEAGQVYESRGYYLDGEFFTERNHRFAYSYPSGCPKFRARDVTEIADAEGWLGEP